MFFYNTFHCRCSLYEKPNKVSLLDIKVIKIALQESNMSEYDPLWTSFFIGVGASIFGGAVAGYVLLQQPGFETYLLLLGVGALICFIGLWKGYESKKKS